MKKASDFLNLIDIIIFLGETRYGFPGSKVVKVNIAARQTKGFGYSQSAAKEKPEKHRQHRRHYGWGSCPDSVTLVKKAAQFFTGENIWDKWRSHSGFPHCARQVCGYAFLQQVFQKLRCFDNAKFLCLPALVGPKQTPFLNQFFTDACSVNPLCSQKS
jgi:hypothetical protein